MTVPLFSTPVPSTQDPDNFSQRADILIAELNPFVEALNTAIAAINTISTTATSTTSNTIGIGIRTFTVEAGKSLFTGMSLTIAFTAGATLRMFAVVTSYSGSTLVVNVQAFEGSGTYNSWSISASFNGVISTPQIQDLAVTTFKIAELAVTAAKVANNTLTLNKMARVGTAGQFLTSGGAGADPSYTTLASATQAQAEAGTDNSTFLTPLRLRNGLNATGTAPIYACRAWVNFNGTGTVAIRGSGNVSSITDNGVGNYTVNFATAMPDANYGFSIASTGNSGSTSASQSASFSNVPETGNIRVLIANSGSGALTDVNYVSVNIFR